MGSYKTYNRGFARRMRGKASNTCLTEMLELAYTKAQDRQRDVYVMPTAYGFQIAQEMPFECQVSFYTVGQAGNVVLYEYTPGPESVPVEQIVEARA